MVCSPGRLFALLMDAIRQATSEQKNSAASTALIAHNPNSAMVNANFFLH
jgi:hypothetical protein